MLSVLGPGRRRGRLARSGEAPTAVFPGCPSAYAKASPVSSCPVRAMIEITQSGGPPRLDARLPVDSESKAAAPTGWFYAKPIAQGAGILSVPGGGLVLSGHPAVGVMLFCVAAGLYGVAVLAALFGPREISRRAFRLLGAAEGSRRVGDDRVPPTVDHGRAAHMCNPPIVVDDDRI